MNDEQERPCTVEDLVVTGTGRYEYSVGPNYSLDQELTSTGLEEIESVDCNNCGWFGQYLKEAREHIENQLKEGK